MRFSYGILQKLKSNSFWMYHFSSSISGLFKSINSVWSIINMKNFHLGGGKMRKAGLQNTLWKFMSLYWYLFIRPYTSLNISDIFSRCLNFTIPFLRRVSPVFSKTSESGNFLSIAPIFLNMQPLISEFQFHCAILFSLMPLEEFIKFFCSPFVIYQ